MVLQKIRKYIEQMRMIRPGDRIIAGVSGGADSVCMLLALAELRESMGFSLEAVHVEHGIRGEESKEDAAFVEELCGRLGILAAVRAVNVPEYAKRQHMGTEEAARTLRYEVFREAARGQYEEAFCEDSPALARVRIATAHHQEDNAETVLFHLVRGSGVGGLRGMEPVCRRDGNCFIRPLLCLGRGEIEEYLRSRGQQYREDSTNDDLRYARNRLRHRVIPELAAVNLQAVPHINESARRIAEVWDYLQLQTDAVSAALMRVDGERVEVDVRGLGELHPALRSQLLFRAICRAAGHSRDITAEHIRQAVDLAQGQSGRRFLLPYGVTAWREFDRILFVKGRRSEEYRRPQEPIVLSKSQLEEIRLCGEARAIDLPDGCRVTLRIQKYSDNFRKIVKKRYTKCLDYDKIIDKLEIRHRKPGDFLPIRGGHRKKLKQLLIEERIPAAEREALWLFAEGSCVLWLVGSRTGEQERLSADTADIIVIEFFRYEGGGNGIHEKA